MHPSINPVIEFQSWDEAIGMALFMAEYGRPAKEGYKAKVIKGDPGLVLPWRVGWVRCND